jgi:hypothetical protein
MGYLYVSKLGSQMMRLPCSLRGLKHSTECQGVDLRAVQGVPFCSASSIDIPICKKKLRLCHLRRQHLQTRLVGYVIVVNIVANKFVHHLIIRSMKMNFSLCSLHNSPDKYENEGDFYQWPVYGQTFSKQNWHFSFRCRTCRFHLQT